MKRIRRAYSKTVSLIDETAVQIYQSFVGKKKGFLLESYDKNNGRYVFMGKNPEEVIKSKENGLVIEKEDGTTKELSGNPVDLLKGYYSDFEIRKDDEQLAFTGGLVGGLGYDFVRYKEELPDNNPDEIGISTISLMLVTEFLSIDHFAETMTAMLSGMHLYLSRVESSITTNKVSTSRNRIIRSDHVAKKATLRQERGRLAAPFLSVFGKKF